MKQNKYSMNFKFKQYCESVLNVSLFWYIFFSIPLMSKVLQKRSLTDSKNKNKNKEEIKFPQNFQFHGE